jgi:hypothetical protein
MHRRFSLTGGIAACLAACAPARPLPPASPPLTEARPKLTATIVGFHPLAPAEFRAAVLISLTGATAPPVAVASGAELVVQTNDGHTLSCIAHGQTPPQIGVTISLQGQPDCTWSAHIAVTPAIR